MSNILRTKALYSLIGLADKAKNLQDYKLANLTFGLCISILDDGEFKIIYENADNLMSAYYDVVTVYLGDRGLSIPAPLLRKDTLVECLKKGRIIERLEHNRQYRQFKDWNEWRKAYQNIVSRFFKILKTCFDINNIETALWALDMPKEFEEWCFDFLTETESEELSLADEKTQEQGLRPHRIIEKKCSIS
jgi:hypothetical protein